MSSPVKVGFYSRVKRKWRKMNKQWESRKRNISPVFAIPYKNKQIKQTTNNDHTQLFNRNLRLLTRLFFYFKQEQKRKRKPLTH